MENYLRNEKDNPNFQSIIDKLLVELESQNLKLGRICLHNSYKDPTQIMVIALHQDYLVKYHLHNGPELLNIIEGELLISEMVNKDKLKDHVLSKKKLFMLKMSKGVIHSVKSLTKWSVFLEVGNGPFDENKTSYI